MVFHTIRSSVCPCTPHQHWPLQSRLPTIYRHPVILYSRRSKPLHTNISVAPIYKTRHQQFRTEILSTASWRVCMWRDICSAFRILQRRTKPVAHSEFLDSLPLHGSICVLHRALQRRKEYKNEFTYNKGK